MTEIEEFEIRTDVICNYYDGDENRHIRIDLIELLRHKEKDTSEIFLDIVNRKNLTSWTEQLPDREKWLESNQATPDCYKKMVELIQSHEDAIYDQPGSTIKSCINIYSFPSYPVVPSKGLILNQREEVNLQERPALFRKFFAFVFSKTDYPAEFISYHLTKTFDGDVDKYKRFLLNVEKDHKAILGDGYPLWSNILTSLEVKLVEANQLTGANKKERTIAKTLPDLMTEEGKKAWPWIKQKFIDKKPKDYAKLYYALVSLKYLPENLYRAHLAMQTEWNNIGSRENMNKHSFTESELNPLIQKLKKAVSQI